MITLIRWTLHVIIGAIAGLVIGYSLGWLWFLFVWLVLGYGDSGPTWINTSNDYVFLFGFIIGILGGQIIFLKTGR